MRRFPRIFPLILVAAISLGQSASLMMNPDVRRVGMKLACLCGVCKNSVGDCVMLGCHYSGGARERILKMQSAGTNDEGIIAKFVSEQGLKALAVPPASGFNLTAWTMPFIMLALGLYAIYVYVKRMRRPAVATGPAPSSKYRDLAAKDLDALE